MSEDIENNVDKETGEILEDTDIPNSPEFVDERLKTGSFFKIFKSGLPWIYKNITDSSIRLFMYFIHHMGDKNFVNYKQQDIADTLSYTRRSVSRHLKDLEQADILVYGRGWCQLNPNVVWYGAYESERAVAVNIYYRKRYQKLTARHNGKKEKQQQK